MANARLVDVTQVGHGSWVSRVPDGVATGEGRRDWPYPPCPGCSLRIVPERLAAHRPWCSNANFTPHVPKYHHPASQGVVQKSLRVLDEAVRARVAGVWQTLEVGTVVSVTSGGVGSTGRQCWQGKMMDGQSVEIPVA